MNLSNDNFKKIMLEINKDDKIDDNSPRKWRKSFTINYEQVIKEESPLSTEESNEYDEKNQTKISLKDKIKKFNPDELIQVGNLKINYDH